MIILVPHPVYLLNIGWAAFGEDGAMNTGTLVTLGALGTLVFLVVIIVIAFFSHRRMSDETQSRKVSRSSTNQLIADVANGLAAHIEGPDPDPDPGPSSSSGGTPIVVATESPCSPFHNCYADVQTEGPPTNSRYDFYKTV